jgi:colanic acid/amylovoran biosynthesis protein
MDIYAENGAHRLGNLGDISMLRVALARLSSFWPESSINVVTSAPDKLAKLCPNARPINLSGRHIWFSPLIGRFSLLLPSSVAQHWSYLEWELRQQAPSLVRSWWQLKLKVRRHDNKGFKSFLETVYESDLVVATGGGYITDEFPELASTVLSMLGMAKKLGKPTVMLGHGLGPLQNPRLRTIAKAVLPSVDLITLRERRAGIPLLDSLGVSQKRVITTGDDAIELAYEARNRELGQGIGVNLRMAKYAGVSGDMLETVRSALQDVARIKGALLLPLPISQDASDVQTIQKLMAGYDDNSDGGESLDTPLKVIKQVGHCRVVVTGSYHAGVFALAQGIPVVGLAKSQYYIDKFLGLADQFGTGCEVILLDDNQLREKLIVSIDNAWMSAETVRLQLLESARRQIESGHAAYQRVYDLVNSRRAVSSMYH